MGSEMCIRDSFRGGPPVEEHIGAGLDEVGGGEHGAVEKLDLPLLKPREDCSGVVVRVTVALFGDDVNKEIERGDWFRAW